MVPKQKKAEKDVFFCEECGVEHIQWAGKCSSCGVWNSVKPFRQSRAMTPIAQRRVTGSLGPTESDGGSGKGIWLSGGLGRRSGILSMDSVVLDASSMRLRTFSDELDRVLGGGFTKGGVVLLAGEPGVGKSTLIIQVAASIAGTLTAEGASQNVVYVSGEENSQQIADRARRLSLQSQANIFLICDANVDLAVEEIESLSPLPALVIVDSVQTTYTDDCPGAVGTVSQIRESTAKLIQMAKQLGISVILLGHVTKSGEVAGPRVLEHMVDTVLFMDSSDAENLKFIRSIKNRFGATSEVGIFSMGQRGLTDVANPSEVFVSDALAAEGQEGAAVAVVIEGSRAMLAEIQCLVGTASFSPNMKSSARRTADGFPIQRLLLLVAVLEKRLRITLWNRDVFLSVAGGLKVSEPSCDLAVAVALVSSAAGLKVRKGFAFIGEIGLSGDIRRGGRRTEQRIAEAVKLGFTNVIVPGEKRKTVPNSGPQFATLRKAAPNARRRSALEQEGMSASRQEAQSTTASGPEAYSSIGGGVDADNIIRCSSLLEALQVALDGNLDTVLSALRGQKKTAKPDQGTASNNDGASGMTTSPVPRDRALSNRPSSAGRRALFSGFDDEYYYGDDIYDDEGIDNDKDISYPSN